MLIDSLQPDRDMILMLDGSWRAVPLVDEVAEHLQLQVRPFPDGRPRVSFSLRGLWSISSSTKLFSDWAKLPVSRLRSRSENAFLASGDIEDVFVDAAEFLELAGGVRSQRLRAAIVFVNEARVKEAVDRRDRSELVGILALPTAEARARRIREVYGVDVVESAGVEQFTVSGCSQADSVGETVLADAGADFSAAGHEVTISVPFTEFHYNSIGFRSTFQDGEGWFVRADVCNALGISNSRDVAGRLEDDEKGVGFIDTLGGRQKLALVNESGLYSLVFGSKKPEARAFRRWVTSVVLPAVRKTGGYQSTRFVAVDRALGDHMVGPRSAVRSSELRRIVSPVRCYLPVGPDHGLTADTLPMTLYDFLVYSMIPEPYARKISPGLEQQLCGDVLRECVLNGAAKLCTDGRTFFARPVLRAWWEMNADDLIGKMGDECPWVFSRGLSRRSNRWSCMVFW